MESDREMPKVLQDLHGIAIDYADGDGIDFEPFDAFLSVADTTAWIRAWTGYLELDGDSLLVFGQDASGGYAALWRTEPDLPIADLPIVFLGSEGEAGVVAGNLSNYLWLLAGDVGPYEAVAYPGLERSDNAAFAEFAARHATTPRKDAWQVVREAQAAIPDFPAQMLAQLRRS